MSIETHPDESLMATFPSHVHRVNSSEITDLFTINMPPNDIQRISLDTAIVRHMMDIANLYASLDKCKRLHSRLHEEIFLAKTDVGCIKAITHPIHLMLSKSLLEIFKYRRKGKFKACVSPADELWRCAQVCQHWWDICLMTPALWTNVHLNFYSDSGQLLLDKEVTRYALCILEKHLSRTRNRPIDITIMAPQLHIVDNPLIHCIICRCEHWHSFLMDAPLQTWQSMNVCEGSLYELTSLKIADSSYSTQWDAAYSNEIILSFTFLPKIEILSISDVPLRALTASPATFCGLKQFEVHLHRQATEVFDLLPCMTSVTSLDISCNADIGEFHRDIVIPSVTSLIL
ncbi:uncharacterized protein ARMOST_21886 [Armillaria ostoyae]|uniref:Uncharacterized protein n=1 Tax=Armillaria ostoyae TaxID=47428 RepID=A0A284SBB5_ARMOS|nr:uncharacterized protein ARMOST_21886 [Armillaria ostoyae]